LTAGAIFDIDGTLVTFRFDVQGTRRALIRELSSRGFRTDGLSLTTPTQVILDTAEGQVRRGEVNADFDSLRGVFYQILDKFELDSVAFTSILPGTAESLTHLKSRGVRLAVLTNSGRKAATATLERAGLNDMFEFVLTRDDTASMKPRPEGLGKALLMLDLPPSEVYYVGDTPMDIIAAKAAGLKVISVATGSYSEDRLRSEGADYVVSSMAGLARIIGL
jgi:HAD superfamily hydrolase (TIGR01509 family)